MRVRERLDGARLGLTGVTGFVGQALLARVLDDLPGSRIVVLARGRAGEPAEQRVRNLLDTAPAFGRLRETGRLEAAARHVEVVEADLTDEHLTVPPIDVLLHVAGTVSFDSRIEEAFRTHTSGVHALYRATADAGCTHVVHVSTAYVAALRPGPVPEEPCRGELDWRAEAAAAERLAERAELVSREPGRLVRFLDEARRTAGAHGAQAVAEEAERARREWVDDQLVAAGRQRARTLGFSDVYTLTKALGERVAEEVFGDGHLSIVRPTIIESSLHHPYPGWIEGFKVADPLIVGLGRGDIPDFPGFADSVVDLVPVDHVASALIVAASSPPPAGSPRYVTVGTGARNPIHLHRVYSLVRQYFEAHPLPGADGTGHRLPSWSFPGPDRIERQLRIASRVTRRANQVVRRSPLTGDRIRRVGRALNRQERRVRALRRFHDLYAVYTETEAVFLDDEAQQLRDGLDPEDREAFGFDPAAIDWPDYLTEVHAPAVTAPLRDPAFVQPRPTPPLPIPHPPVDGGATVLAVFDLDGTVADANVLTTYLRARWHDDRAGFAREALDVLRALPRYASLDATGRERFLRAFYRRFAGADVAALDRLAVEQLHDHLLRDLNPAAVRRIREHRRAGHHTVLLTGALKSFCLPFTALFDTIAATELETDADGIATGHLAAPPLVGGTRARWLAAFAREAGADLGASFAYADSRSDVPLLRAVGNPVVVNPDVTLHRLARRQRWPVVTWDASTRPLDGAAADLAGTGVR